MLSRNSECLTKDRDVLLTFYDFPPSTGSTPKRDSRTAAYSRSQQIHVAWTDAAEALANQIKVVCNQKMRPYEIGGRKTAGESGSILVD